MHLLITLILANALAIGGGGAGLLRVVVVVVLLPRR